MNMKRMRGRNHRPGGGGGGGGGGGFRNQQNGIPLNRNHVFDSSGPEMRVRGTAQQLFDKYTQMARDASSSGDRVLGESYYQHAEHYFRIISAINQAQGIPNPPQAGEDGEPRPEQRPERQENRQEFRQERPERQENRENRPENRNENRPENRNENRNENRQERRFEQRPRPEFQPRERGERPFRQPQPQIADAPIDISSALEAELAAAVAEPAGFGEQPVIQQAAPKVVVQQELPIATPEPRAIPIRPAAPPPVVDAAPAVEAAPAEEPAPRPRPRGRPRTVKPVAEKAPE